ncbi:MAG TPA: LEA type 2 family protein [Adhaeribacter sp.]|nr:LEA type 2 family protein [Adhaeribacter sp.]
MRKTWKWTGIIILIILLLAGLLALWLYQNRQRFYPKVEEVTYLEVKTAGDSAMVLAGIRILNRAPLSFQTDSIHYQIRSNGTLLGYGNQLVGQTLPAFKNTVLNGRLFLNTQKYRQHLNQNQNQDSLALDLSMQIYLDLPFFDPKTVNIDRRFKTAIPKAPALKIDSFFVKSFSPEAGYTFQLNLNTGNTTLPDLKIKDLHYSIRLSDSLVISGKTDSAFHIKDGQQLIEVPVHLETAEMIALLGIKLGKQKIWPYQAKASALLETPHPLFRNTAVSLERSGTLDTRKVGGGTQGRPEVKQIESLQLLAKEKSSWLEAGLLIHNPTPLPLYLDSARYVVRHKGKIVARGGGNFEKVFPARKDQRLQLQLTVDNQQYQQIMAQPRSKDGIPLEVELVLHYNLKGSSPIRIPVKKTIMVPVTQGPEFEFADIIIKQLDPEKGAQLLVKMKVKNQGATQLQLDDLHYHLQLRKDIQISGKTGQPITIDSGTTEIEVPVDLSGEDVNLVAKGLIQGIETWPYTFTGTATVSTPNSLLHQTKVSLQTSGVYEIKSKGTPDYMPELSKIDTLNVTIRYDTAWVQMYAAIYNTLPATIHVSKLQVDVIHENDTIGKTEETLNIALLPDTNTFTWHFLGVNFDIWEKHVAHHQGEDSMKLILPATLFFELGNLGSQHVLMDWSTLIPTPASPVTLLQRLKLRGFSFASGLKFDALVAVQNANSTGLTVQDIEYAITLENGVDICGKINRTYTIPLGISEVKVPISLSVWEALKLLKRQFLGPFLIDYKINATALVSTNNPKLKNMHVIFENWNQSDLKQEKTLKSFKQAH